MAKKPKRSLAQQKEDIEQRMRMETNRAAVREHLHRARVAAGRNRVEVVRQEWFAAGVFLADTLGLEPADLFLNELADVALASESSGESPEAAEEEPPL